MNTKYESFLLSLPDFKSQEELVMDCIRDGYNTPELVTRQTGKKESSIRRAFSDLKKAGDIIVIKTDKNLAGNREIEVFGINTKQLSLIK